MVERIGNGMVKIGVTQEALEEGVDGLTQLVYILESVSLYLTAFEHTSQNLLYLFLLFPVSFLPRFLSFSLADRKMKGVIKNG